MGAGVPFSASGCGTYVGRGPDILYHTHDVRSATLYDNLPAFCYPKCDTEQECLDLNITDYSFYVYGRCILAGNNQAAKQDYLEVCLDGGNLWWSSWYCCGWNGFVVVIVTLWELEFRTTRNFSDTLLVECCPILNANSPTRSYSPDIKCRMDAKSPFVVLNDIPDIALTESLRL